LCHGESIYRRSINVDETIISVHSCKERMLGWTILVLILTMIAVSIYVYAGTCGNALWHRQNITACTQVTLMTTSEHTKMKQPENVAELDIQYSGFSYGDIAIKIVIKLSTPLDGEVAER